MQFQFIDKGSVKHIEDLRDIVQIGKESLPIYYKLHHLTEMLHSSYLIYKCNLENEPMGFCVLEICDENKIHIMSIAISKLNRGKGYGSKIMEFLKKTFLKYTLSLYVQIQNKDAVRFYLKHNFKIKKTLVNYYDKLEHKNAYYCEFKYCDS
jgi:ribosomal protein S18 acetylase RimI-like enzyme